MEQSLLALAIGGLLVAAMLLIRGSEPGELQ
jgi:hypothetical protein